MALFMISIYYVVNDRDQGYYIVYDINYANSCKDRTEQLALMPNKRKIKDNESGYRERETAIARTEKLILDQNIKTEYMVHYRKLILDHNNRTEYMVHYRIQYMVQDSYSENREINLRSKQKKTEYMGHYRTLVHNVRTLSTLLPHL